ncbi:15663_t:CDS:2, partial [Funneliformis mosseae]
SLQHIFDTLNHLPDPILANSDHYKSFNDVYSTDTNESYCPSIELRKVKLNKNKRGKLKQGKQMPWTGNAQKAKNVGVTVTCMDCNKLRCLYASKKITEDEKKILMRYLDTICYTYGATFTCHNGGSKDSLKKSSQKRHIDEVLEDDELIDVLSKVFVNAALECYDEMEKAYYSAKFLPVCFNCDSFEYIIPVPEKQYPYCEACTADSDVKIKMGRGLNFSSDAQSSKRKGKKVRTK